MADLDDVLSRATAAGARLVSPRTSMPFGDDAARITDPWGNLWWLHEHVQDVELSELIGRMADSQTLARLQSFDATLDTEMRRRAATEPT